MTLRTAKHVLVGAILLTQVLVASAQAKDFVLPPVTPWALDATPSGCALRRGFGDVKNPLVLEMQRFAPGDSFQLVVGGDQLQAVKSATRVRVRYGALPFHDDPIDFMPGTTPGEGGKLIPTLFTSSSLGKEEDASGVGSVTPEMEAQVTEIGIGLGRTTVTLKTGPLDKPFAAVRQCTDALVKSWGLDPAVQNSLSWRARPIGRESWGRKITYPSGAAARGRQARVNFRLIVGADGKPTDCKVLRSYNEPAFDAAACKSLMSFARFEPALDSAGQPTPSFYVNAIVWTLG